jgi:hypothetical protein
MKTIRINRRRVTMLALVVALGWGSAVAQDAPAAVAPMPIYTNALAPGWQNWSWANTRLSVGAEGATRRPIAVEADAYEALYLSHPAFATSGYKALALLVQGTTPEGEVRVFLLSNGKPNGTGKLVKIGNTGWTQVQIPLETLSSQDATIDGVWIQNPSSQAMPKFYVADVWLQ